MTAILALLSNWRVILGLGIAGAVLGFGLYVWHLRDEVASQKARADLAEASLSQQIQVNQQNLQQLALMRAADAAALDAMTKQRDAVAARTALTVQLKGKTSHVSKANDGPVAPVLRDVLDGLRGPAATAAAH